MAIKANINSIARQLEKLFDEDNADDATKELIHELEAQMKKLIYLEKEITVWLASIPDYLIQAAIRDHYINGYTWAEVAAHCPGNTKDSIKKMVQRFLKTCPQCPDKK
ncbi:MAG: hypothetical protein MJ120_00125 [Clostridia bacterium]|nr:hypothetical protein [Clostridia bacterium]